MWSVDPEPRWEKKRVSRDNAVCISLQQTIQAVIYTCKNDMDKLRKTLF